MLPLCYPYITVHPLCDTAAHLQSIASQQFVCVCLTPQQNVSQMLSGGVTFFVWFLLQFSF